MVMCMPITEDVIKRECKYNETREVNSYERYYIDIDDEVIEENRKKRGPKTPLIGNLFPK